ncbi:Uncharacterised protein [Yersinia enterocolitica]|nr:Uncharacterised protein [Yersinia enterocolitica]
MQFTEQFIIKGINRLSLPQANGGTVGGQMAFTAITVVVAPNLLNSATGASAIIAQPLLCQPV